MASLSTSYSSSFLAENKLIAKAPQTLPVSCNPTGKASQNGPRNPVMLAIFLLGTLMYLAVFVSSYRMFLSPTQLFQAPSIQLNSLSVSQFKVSNSALAANWDVNLTFENSNTVSNIVFNRIECFVSYQDNVLAVSSIEPFALALKEEKRIRLSISITGLEGDQPIMKETVLREIQKEKERKSAVNFRVQMTVWASYKDGWSRTMHVIMKPDCPELRVQFSHSSRFGRWVDSEGPRKCLVPMTADS